MVCFNLSLVLTTIAVDHYLDGFWHRLRQTAVMITTRIRRLLNRDISPRRQRASALSGLAPAGSGPVAAMVDLFTGSV
jgi:hypothetical protein